MKKRLTVVIQEGSISAVVSDRPEDFQDIEVVSINYYCDATSDLDLARVRQGDGTTQVAFVGRWSVDPQEVHVIEEVESRLRNIPSS